MTGKVVLEHLFKDGSFRFLFLRHCLEVTNGLVVSRCLCLSLLSRGEDDHWKVKLIAFFILNHHRNGEVERRFSCQLLKKVFFYRLHWSPVPVKKKCLTSITNRAQDTRLI